RIGHPRSFENARALGITARFWPLRACRLSVLAGFAAKAHISPIRFTWSNRGRRGGGDHCRLDSRWVFDLYNAEEERNPERAGQAGRATARGGGCSIGKWFGTGPSCIVHDRR